MPQSMGLNYYSVLFGHVMMPRIDSRKNQSWHHNITGQQDPGSMSEDSETRCTCQRPLHMGTWSGSPISGGEKAVKRPPLEPLSHPSKSPP